MEVRPGTVRPGMKKYRDGGYVLGDGKSNLGVVRAHIDHSLKASKVAQSWYTIFIVLIVLSAIVAVVMFLSGNTAVQVMAPIFLGIAGGLIPVTLIFYFIYRFFGMMHDKFLWDEYQWYIDIKLLQGQVVTEAEMKLSTPVVLASQEANIETEED